MGKGSWEFFFQLILKDKFLKIENVFRESLYTVEILN